MNQGPTSTRARWKKVVVLQGLALLAAGGLSGAAYAAHDNGNGKSRGLACGHASRQISPQISPPDDGNRGRACPPQAGPKTRR